ncbi:MAG: AraC family transcriptional regulator [Methylococcaceae bacterium]|nr:AraC family transcriptional regulator [Methylococcaceae bacterium]
MIDHSEDPLSTLLTVIRLRARIYNHETYCGEWKLDSPQEPRASFHLLASGRGRLTMLETGLEVSLRGGDLVLLPRNTSHRLCGEEGEGFTTLLCGYFEFSFGSANPILDALPDLVVIPMEDPQSCAQLMALSGLLLAEAEQARNGSRFALDRLAEVLFVMMIRRYLERTAETGGVLAGLADRRISRALAAMHREPERAWQVETLAKMAGMSRTAFAQRFAKLLGQPPLAYLSSWRMLLAERWLTEERLSVAKVAERLGYGSETAFRRAFKRSRGTGPGSFRRRMGMS